MYKPKQIRPIPALSSKHFELPHPRRPKENLMLLYEIESFLKLPPNVPGISLAGYKVLGKLYYKRSSATVKELGTNARVIKPLVDASLAREPAPNLITLTPKGYRCYEMYYYRRQALFSKDEH